MKFISILVLAFLLASTGLYSQFGLGKILKRKVEEKVEKKTEEAVEKALEEPSEETESEEENNDKTKQKDDEPTILRNESPDVPNMQTYSKFDFIPGDRIIFFEDFSQDNVGDFPAKWNTNGSGEVITTNLYTGKWLKMVNDANYVPDMNHPFPENFTLEFDLLTNFEQE